MKRRTSLFLALTLVFSLCVPAFAAESVTPTPPSWVREEEYIVFPGSYAYESKFWNYVTQLRADAEAGGKKPQKGDPLWTMLTQLSALGSGSLQGYKGHDQAAEFELALLELMWHKNAGYPDRWATYEPFSSSVKDDKKAGGPNAAKLSLWHVRSMYQINFYLQPNKDLSSFADVIEETMRINGLNSLNQFLAYGALQPVDPAEYERLSQALSAERAKIYVYLDGEEIIPGRDEFGRPSHLPGRAQNGRTLVPIRAISEALGAEVKWVQETNQVHLMRGGDEIVMTLSQTEATRNGVSFQMDVAPFAEAGTTFVPVRYIAEFFGQMVEWDGPHHRVLVTENKTVVQPSNLEAWALPMGAILTKVNRDDPTLFGTMIRSHRYLAPVDDGRSMARIPAQTISRDLLWGGWGIQDREALMTTTAALATGSDAWDWFRVSSLAQWGYLAGYVTYPEALALVEPAAQKVCETYGSWDEAQGAYLAGYCKWAGLSAADIWATPRGQLYGEMKADPAVAPIFDDALFTAGVIGLPD